MFDMSEFVGRIEFVQRKLPLSLRSNALLHSLARSCLCRSYANSLNSPTWELCHLVEPKSVSKGDFSRLVSRLDSRIALSKADTAPKDGPLLLQSIEFFGFDMDIMSINPRRVGGSFTMQPFNTFRKTRRSDLRILLSKSSRTRTMLCVRWIMGGGIM